MAQPRIVLWLKSANKLSLIFLICALVLQGFYIAHFSILEGTRAHGDQRMLHVAHLANSLFDDTNRLPASFREFIKTRRYWHQESAHVPFGELMAIPLRPSDTMHFHSSRNAAQYPPIGYMFYVLPMAIGLLCGLPPALIITLALSFNATLLIGLGAYVLSKLPVLRWPVFFLLMMPSSFLIRSFIMADGITIELSFLMLALALHYAGHPSLLSRGKRIVLLLLAAAIGAVKVAYFLMPCVYWLIPQTAFANARDRKLFVALALGLSIAMAGLWDLYTAMQYYPEILESKWRLVIEHPLDLIALIYRPFFTYELLVDNIFCNMVSYGTFSISPPALLLTLLPLPLLAITEAASGNAVYSLGQRWLVTAIFFITWGVIMIAMLLHSTQTDYLKAIEGYHLSQGRFAVPVLPCLLLAIRAIIDLPKIWQIYLRRFLQGYATVSLVYLHSLAMHLL